MKTANDDATNTLTASPRCGVQVPSSANDFRFREIISNLLVKSARAVVLFTRSDDAR
jgi:hypothetical protein